MWLRAAAVAWVLLGGVVLSAAADHVPVEEIRWACGPFGSGQRGHPDGCGIDPIDAPTFGDNWLAGSDRVLGISLGGDARAYPIRVLDQHEIVNDVVAGSPVAITYCPLCGSGVTFDRVVQVDGEPVTMQFTASGFLYKHDLVMYDPQTQTLWTQILGRPIGTLIDERVGADHVEARLQPHPTQVMSWDDWRSLHPDSLLLEPPRGAAAYARTAYAGYGDDCRLGISGQRACDIDGLHPKELVFGVAKGGSTIAYPLFALGQQGLLVDPERDLVVVASGAGDARAYATGGRNFTAVGDGIWQDDSGAAWHLPSATSADGVQQLDAVDGLVLYWFAWQAHQPETELWLPEDAGGGKATDESIPGVGVGAALLALGAALIVSLLGRRVSHGGRLQP